MPEKLFRRKARKITPKKAPKEAVKKTVLVGTYRGDQLEKWRGYYNYPLTDKDAFDLESAKKVNELWLFRGAADGRFYSAQFVGEFTRDELKAKFGYPAASGRGHGSRYLLYKISPTQIYDPASGLAEAVIVRTADFARSPKVRKQLKAYLESPDRADPDLAKLLPTIVTKVPRENLRVCEAAVQLEFLSLFGNHSPVQVVPRATGTRYFTVIDLFAGIGGFRLAAERCGGKCINFSEINPDAISAYVANNPESERTNLGDVTKLKDLPSHDLLTGGVPCQSWSIAGKNLGFDDDRGQLWNDAIFLLNKSRPKAFIFENVKGLADPRNEQALNYIVGRIKEAGYHASWYVLNSFDYGVPQSRVRIYIIGFRDKNFAERFRLPSPVEKRIVLADILDDKVSCPQERGRENDASEGRGAGDRPVHGATSLSTNNGFNDYFLFNDLRNGATTIHSWDILETTDHQKRICLLLLKNRRRSEYGPLDGNPLSLRDLQKLDGSISQKDLDDLIDLGILHEEKYRYQICMDKLTSIRLTEEETLLLSFAREREVVPDFFSHEKEIRKKGVDVLRVLSSLEAKGVLHCVESKYDFKNTKISTGLFGVNRIVLPSSSIFPTLVASDSNDYVTSIDLKARSKASYRRNFLEYVYRRKRFRKISKREACRIQGFPADFILPPTRARWMKLIGNSVAVPVVEKLVQAVVDTGVFS